MGFNGGAGQTDMADTGVSSSSAGAREATGGTTGFFAEQRRVLIVLIARITGYYLVVGAAAFGLIKLFPGLLAVMPIGGIVDIRPDPFFRPDQIVTQTPIEADASVWLNEAITLSLAMAITLIAMVPVSWLYKAIHEGHDYDHSIDETALVMPAVVAGVVTVAQHSLALAFSLAGIVAGVRFRRALSDTFDTLFIFVAIGVGLAAGVAAIEIAIVITVFFNYATAVTCIFGDGLESKYIAEKEQRRLDRRSADAKKRKAGDKKKKKRRHAGTEAPPRKVAKRESPAHGVEESLKPERGALDQHAASTRENAASPLPPHTPNAEKTGGT